MYVFIYHPSMQHAKQFPNVKHKLRCLGSSFENHTLIKRKKNALRKKHKSTNLHTF